MDWALLFLLSSFATKIASVAKIVCTSDMDSIAMSDPLLHIYSPNYPQTVSLDEEYTCQSSFTYIDFIYIEGNMQGYFVVICESYRLEFVHIIFHPARSDLDVAHCLGDTGVVMMAMADATMNSYNAFHVIVHAYDSQPDCFEVAPTDQFLELHQDFVVAAQVTQRLRRSENRSNDSKGLPTCKWSFRTKHGNALRVDVEVTSMSMRSSDANFGLDMSYNETLLFHLDKPNQSQQSFLEGHDFSQYPLEITYNALPDLFEAVIFMRFFAYEQEETISTRCAYQLFEGETLTWAMGRLVYRPLFTGDQRDPYLPNQKCHWTIRIPDNCLLYVENEFYGVAPGDIFEILVDEASLSEHDTAVARSKVEIRFETDPVEASGGPEFVLTMTNCDCNQWSESFGVLSNEWDTSIYIPGTAKSTFNTRTTPCLALTCTWKRNATGRVHVIIAWNLFNNANLSLSSNSGKLFFEGTSNTTDPGHLDEHFIEGDVEIRFVTPVEAQDLQAFQYTIGFISLIEINGIIVHESQMMALSLSWAMSTAAWPFGLALKFTAGASEAKTFLHVHFVQLFKDPQPPYSRPILLGNQFIVYNTLEDPLFTLHDPMDVQRHADSAASRTFSMKEGSLSVLRNAATKSAPSSPHLLVFSVSDKKTPPDIIYADEMLTRPCGRTDHFVLAARTKSFQPRLGFYSPQLSDLDEITMTIRAFGASDLAAINITSLAISQGETIHREIMRSTGFIALPWHMIEVNVEANHNLSITFASDVESDAQPAICNEWVLDDFVAVLLASDMRPTFPDVVAEGAITFRIHHMLTSTATRVRLLVDGGGSIRLDGMANDTIVTFKEGGRFQLKLLSAGQLDRFRISFEIFNPSNSRAVIKTYFVIFITVVTAFIHVYSSAPLPTEG